MSPSPTGRPSTWCCREHSAGKSMRRTWVTRVSAITVWLEVRVLSAPPRSPAQQEISRFSANSPELAAIRHSAPIRATVPLIEQYYVAVDRQLKYIELRGPFRGLCLCAGKLRFPTAGAGLGRDSVRILGQCDGKPSISRRRPFFCCGADGDLDEVGREEGE
jgi:hypothetical protein